MAEIDATAAHYLFDLVGSNLERQRVDPVSKQEFPASVTVVFGNPSVQVVRQLEEAELVKFIGAALFGMTCV